MRKRTDLPFMSVALPVYNGSATVGRAIQSLLNQDYPKDKFEIIVVNDGSTDNTEEVVRSYPTVQYVPLPRNMGIPAAQNAGLKVARGDIYVNFNDDCQAAPDFLTQLAKGYATLDRPVGIGGVVIKQRTGHIKGLMAHFIEASGSGAAPGAEDVGPAFLPGPAKRLLSYLFGNYLSRKRVTPTSGYEEVVELYGANASFPIKMLRAVDGWDETMAAPAIGGIEDRDVCYRLRQRFADHHFYALHAARVMLEQDPNDTAVSMKAYLLRQYRRGPFNYAFHARNGLMPPLFPFPFAVALGLLMGLVVAPWWLPVLVLLLPQLCYGWWLQRAVRERKASYMLFPYLQLAEETMVIAGLARGFIVHNRRNHAAR